jgi:hypothetical protein
MALRHIRAAAHNGLRHKHHSAIARCSQGMALRHYIRLMLTSWKLKRSGGSAQMGLGVRPAQVL